VSSLSSSTAWETPQRFFDLLDHEFHFQVDVCAFPETAKCLHFFTEEDDGLAQPWAPAVAWMNPPYGRGISRWMAKAAEEAQRGATVVCLVPASTDARWWRTYAPLAEVRLVAGQLHFLLDGVAGKRGPKFPSAVLIFRPDGAGAGVTRSGRSCDACGGVAGWHGLRRFCSDACRAKAYRERRRSA
jgi:phage N-6-adenine-methyltransferase